MSAIVGYSFDADVYCEGCTLILHPGLDDDTTDSEGNPIHPIFNWDEGWQSDVCGACHFPLDDSVDVFGVFLMSEHKAYCFKCSPKPRSNRDDANRFPILAGWSNPAEQCSVCAEQLIPTPETDDDEDTEGDVNANRD